MARHRNIRSMNYSDEYDGYDDVYGHSVEDDNFLPSPSDAAFMYHRDDSRTSRIGAFFKNDDGIAEENEDDTDVTNLSDLDSAKLQSCVESIKSIIGPSVNNGDIVKAVLKHQFNVDKALDYILCDKKAVMPQMQHAERKETDTIEETNIPSIKVVSVVKTPAAATGNGRSGGIKTPIVTKGFAVKTPQQLQNASPRSQSPSSGRVTPVNLPQTPGYSEEASGLAQTTPVTRKAPNTEEVLEKYKKERGGAKDHLYMVVIGHVDAGKSTLMGHLLCEMGQVNQRTMHKYEQESRKIGKQSFVYAWVLDETGEERNRGITMDVGRAQFETDSKVVTLLDAPGHKDFIPNMISGAGQADVALLVVDATRGEFETGFELGGQTREHALLVRSLGVVQLAVVVNKLDTVAWSKDRFDEICGKLKHFLKQVGFREADVTFVPCSGLTGANLVKKGTEDELVAWYAGDTLIQVIDKFRSPERPIAKPFRLSVNDLYKGTGSNFCVSGRVETGSLNVGDRVLVCPSREIATVKGISLGDLSQQVAFAGDQCSVTLAGLEMQNVSVGYILCDMQRPVQISSKFQARIVVFNVTIPITKGHQVVLHHQSLVEAAVITKLISQLNKSTGEILKKHPRCLSNNSSAMVEVEVQRPVALELYSECKELGRIMLRIGGVTIAAGLITKIIL